MPYLHHLTFDHLDPTEAQKKSMAALREAARVYAAAIEANVPSGADATYILRKLREVAMWVEVSVMRNPDGGPRS